MNRNIIYYDQTNSRLRVIEERRDGNVLFENIDAPVPTATLMRPEAASIYPHARV